MHIYLSENQQVSPPPMGSGIQKQEQTFGLFPIDFPLLALLDHFPPGSFQFIKCVLESTLCSH